MKLFLLAIALVTSQAFATEINLSAGSSAVIRAGDQATVTCQGGGGGGGDHGGGRCRCVVGTRATNPLIDCDGNVGYVLLVNGAPVAKDGCWRTDAVDSAGRACLEKLGQQPQCK